MLDTDALNTMFDTRTTDTTPRAHLILAVEAVALHAVLDDITNLTERLTGHVLDDPDTDPALAAPILQALDAVRVRINLGLATVAALVGRLDTVKAGS